jgi:ribonuclease HI
MEVWKMYFDVSLKLQGARAGILFIVLKGDKLKYALQHLFPISNNAAEYEALIHGLNIAVVLGLKYIKNEEEPNDKAVVERVTR